MNSAKREVSMGSLLAWLTGFDIFFCLKHWSRREYFLALRSVVFYEDLLFYGKC